MATLMDFVLPRLDFLGSTRFWAIFHTVLWYDDFSPAWHSFRGLTARQALALCSIDCSLLQPLAVQVEGAKLGKAEIHIPGRHGCHPYHP